MRRILAGLLLAVPVVAMPLAVETAHAQWVPYSNFNFIDPEKWAGSEADSGFGAPNTEAIRTTVLGKLRMRLVAYGNTTSDSGRSFGRLRLNVTNPSAIIGIESQVTVVHASSQNCPTNSATGEARALVQGGFFNDGTSSGPGDRTGDILAGLQKFIDSNGARMFRAFLIRCTDATCGTFASVVPSQIFVASWNFFAHDVLRVEWDAANDRFIYTLNPNGSSPEVIVLGYSQSDSDPPGLDFKQVAINPETENCLNDRKRSVVDALFNKVQVLPAPLDSE